MSQVEFPDEKSAGGEDFTSTKTPAMVRWVLKTGIVKEQKQANLVLLSVAILFFGITMYMVFGSSSPKPKTTYLEDIPANVRATMPPSLLKTIPSRN